MNDVSITGIGQVPVRERWSSSLGHVAAWAVLGAMEAPQIDSLDSLYVGNTLPGVSTSGSIWARGRPMLWASKPLRRLGLRRPLPDRPTMPARWQASGRTRRTSLNCTTPLASRQPSRWRCAALPRGAAALPPK